MQADLVGWLPTDSATRPDFINPPPPLALIWQAMALEVLFRTVRHDKRKILTTIFHGRC